MRELEKTNLFFVCLFVKYVNWMFFGCKLLGTVSVNDKKP